MPYVGGTAQRTTAEFLIDRLVRNGYSRMQAAAIVGNMQRESQLITNNLNRDEGSYGLMQWRGPRFQQLQQFAAQAGKPWTDPGVQADFMAHEMRTSEAGNARAFNQAQTLDEATRALQPVVRYSTNPATAGLDERLANARTAYGGDPDAPAVAPAAPSENAPQRPGAQPGVVSRETPLDLGARRKGIGGGISGGLGDLGVAYVNRQRTLGQPLNPFAAMSGAASHAGAPGSVLHASTQIPGTESYTDPNTGARMVTGLPGRYSSGDVLNMGQAPAPEPARFPGGRVPLPRARPLGAPGSEVAPTDLSPVDVNQNVASVIDDRMGALVDPYMGFDYG